ncbi:MAG: HDOD domain-containing protein [Armatimonadetes bacterium]|nr:HDOD domain-containing protein [Armatimonadota bacterium]
MQAKTSTIATAADVAAMAQELAALPQVVMKVIDLSNNPRTTATDLERVIGTDQGFAAKVLALANSAYYGLPRRVSSIREAVMFLGFKAVRSIAMTITSFNMFLGKSDAMSLARRELWRHSLNTAVISKTLTSLVKDVIPEEAFVAGLLHDIGKTLLDQHMHNEFLLISEFAKANGVAFVESEKQFLPFNHAQIGYELTKKWQLPSILPEAIGCHHEPAHASLSVSLTATVALANLLAHSFAGQPTRSEAEVEQMTALYPSLLEMLNLTKQQFSQVMVLIEAEMAKGPGPMMG